MSELIFYTNPMSRGQIARWMLEEVGADYEQRLVQYGPEMKGPDYLAINPMGKVPAIVHDGKVVTECAAICAYLAEAFPEAALAPTAEERADYYRWIFFASGPIEQAVISRSMGWQTPEDKQAMLGFGSYELAAATLASWLAEHDYVCGDRFTAADVYVGAQVDWGQAFGTLPALPAFAAYAERLRARPAYQRAKAIDNELIAQAKAKAEAEGASA
ncbi:glutathione S-transferase [Blastomonas natatoria]|uniref:Glutathione S-transferase n=1 Tax=Blastomonas natatoria TaxID=34015 RepID=A0A2V3UVK3_9SPHN|nr:glutathione S-transferase family protein [Blastomonas natatoria]PXW72921.1 glutathione S-transferase [Blastomonas natatoria]